MTNDRKRTIGRTVEVIGSLLVLASIGSVSRYLFPYKQHPPMWVTALFVGGFIAMWLGGAIKPSEKRKDSN